MAFKYQILAKLARAKIIAVIRANNSEQANKIAAACLKGNIQAIEVTYTVPNATEVLIELQQHFAAQNLFLGAGSVLDSKTARTAITAGAQYIVGPNFDAKTCELCNRYQIPYIPGCMTPTEIINAVQAGAAAIKLFPANILTPKFLHAIKGPLPKIPFIATGGINLDNALEWLKNGCIAIGIATALTQGAKTNNYELITETAQQFLKSIEDE